MDIKKYIKEELSLDQKAKLYFMGLVRQGKIDRLPEDPKAAYIKDMMGKMDTIQKISPKVDRSSLEKLTGMDEADRTIKPETDEKRLEDLLNIILKYHKDPDDAEEELANYRERGYPGFSDMLKANLKRDKDFHTWVQVGHDRGLEEGDTYEKMAAKGKKAGNLKQGTVRKRLRIKDGEKIPLARINKAISDLKKRKSLSDKDKKYLKALNLAKTLKTTTNVKEIATELGYLNESKVDISYTDPGFRFYKMKVDGKRFDREEGTEYLKGLGIDMEIPRSYNQSTLDKIVGKLKEKGINADHDAAMDVS